MFVVSVRGNTIRFFGIVFLSLIVLVALIVFIPSNDAVIVNGTPGEEVQEVMKTQEDINYEKIKTNDDRLAFIKQFGWEVNPQARDTVEVKIPAEFDKVFTGYNELQKRTGLDLSKYKNKEMTRYTYEVTNYPNYEGRVYLNLLVYRNKVVGGDICSADVNGFIHGLSAR